MSIQAQPLESTGQVVPVDLGEILPPDLSQAGILLTIPRTKDGNVLTITALHLMQGGLEPWMCKIIHNTDYTGYNKQGFIFVEEEGGGGTASKRISSTCTLIHNIILFPNCVDTL